MTAAPDALREQIAEDLLRIGAVVLRPDEPFTWASGLRAPIYCDNRLTLAYPRVRRRITDGLVALLDGVTVDAVAGVATAGIPQAALVAERLGLPMAYVRAEAKGHGRQNRIEGQVKPGQEVVVVEDLLSTGGSAVSAAEALRAATAEPVAVLAVFTYGLEVAQQRLKEAALQASTLTDLDTLLRVAARTEAVEPDAIEAIRAWRGDPEGWSQQVMSSG